MFDVGFSELLVIAVVALLVLGPERLPKAARFAGLWMRRARAQWHSVKAEFERDLADDDLKRALNETRASLRDAQASLRDSGSGLRREFDDARQTLMQRQPEPIAATALALHGSDLPSTSHAADQPGPDPRQLQLDCVPPTPGAGPHAGQPGAQAAADEQRMHTPFEDPPPPQDDDDSRR